MSDHDSEHYKSEDDMDIEVDADLLAIFKETESDQTEHNKVNANSDKREEKTSLFEQNTPSVDKPAQKKALVWKQQSMDKYVKREQDWKKEFEDGHVKLRELQVKLIQAKNKRAQLKESAEASKDAAAHSKRAYKAAERYHTALLKLEKSLETLIKFFGPMLEDDRGRIILEEMDAIDRWAITVKEVEDFLFARVTAENERMSKGP